MNINTLSKCVEELKKDAPNISYVLGMLETVIEMNGIQVPLPQYHIPTQFPNTYTGVGVNTANGSGLVAPLTAEEITAQRYAGGRIAELGTI